MKIVDFYRGECGNTNGVLLTEIWTWSHGAMEMDHDWVQWVFPSPEQSQLNGDAPTLSKAESTIFCSDPELQDRVRTSLLRMLDFLGFYLAQDDEMVKIERIEPTEERPNPQWWLGAFNHNMLRVTRVLKSLRSTGLHRYALALYDALRPYKEKMSPNTWGHWTRAVFDPLWKDSWTESGF